MSLTIEKQIEEMEILDPTPRSVNIGSGENTKTFVMRPLVMKHYKKLFGLVAGAMQTIKGLVEAGESGDILVALEEIRENPGNLVKYADKLLCFGNDAIMDFVACVLNVEIAWLDDNMQLDQLGELLFIIYQQNEVEKIVGNFTMLGNLAKKRGMLNHPLLRQMQSPGAGSTQS